MLVFKSVFVAILVAAVSSRPTDVTITIADAAVGSASNSTAEAQGLTTTPALNANDSTLLASDENLIPNSNATASVGNSTATGSAEVLTTNTTVTEATNATATPASNPNVLRYSVGFVASWAGRRKCMAVKPTDIDASAYTHIMFSFAIIDDTNKLTFSNTEDSAYLRGLIDHVKDKYPEVKVVIAVGENGSNNTTVSPPRFTRAVETESSRKTLVDSAVSLISEYGADGINLDWMYPTAVDYGGREGDANNYVSLVREMRSAFPPEYSISTVVPIGSSPYYAGFNVTGMAPYVDFIAARAYDLHGIWEYSEANGGKLAAHTDLRDVLIGIDAMVTSGVPVEKILLGLAFYGRSYKQSDPEQYDLGSPFVDPKIGQADPGRCTARPGFLGYNEISEMIEKNVPTVRIHTFEENAVTNILAYGNDQWLTYDDGFTFDERLVYAYDYGFGGTAVWSIDLDDDKRQLSNSIQVMRGKLRA